MIQAADIEKLRTDAEDYLETERLKANLQRLRKECPPFYLTKGDLDPIFKWKLRGQLGRNKKRLEENSDRAYEIITHAAFSIKEDDWKAEAELRVGVLSGNWRESFVGRSRKPIWQSGNTTADRQETGDKPNTSNTISATTLDSGHDSADGAHGDPDNRRALRLTLSGRE